MKPGDSLGRYRLLRRLGAGAMGEVFLAEDPRIGRQLAVKIVSPGLVSATTETATDMAEPTVRLLREARAAGKLLHPNVVALFDVGEEEGAFFLAFEYVDGCDLLARIRQTPPMSLGEILRLGREVAQGLAYAHEHGIVHRDIKPSNVLLDRTGQAKIGDFGIARLADQGTALTTTGAVVGSPQYLAPEQVRGEPLDGRSDLFALGVLLYELLTDRRPFRGEALTTLVYQILHHEPPPVRQLRPGLPTRIEEIVMRLLAKDREDRYSSAAELVTEIEALEGTLSAEILTIPPGGLTPDTAAQEGAQEGAGEDGMATAPTELLGPPKGLGKGTAKRPARRSWIFAAAAAVIAVALAVAFFTMRPGTPRGEVAPLETVASTLDPEPSAVLGASAVVETEETSEEVTSQTAEIGPPRRPEDDPRAGSHAMPDAPGPGMEMPPPELPETDAGTVLQTGLDLHFVAQPFDADVLVDGEIIGRAGRWLPGGGPYRLGAPGSHTVDIQREGFLTTTYRLTASEERRQPTPIISRLQPLPGSNPPESMLQGVYEARKGIVLEVAPRLARILIDGKIMGAAIEFLGGRQGRAGGTVPLEPGIHRITVLAPGFIPQEIEVNVRDDAGVDLQPVRIHLARRGGPAQRRPRRP